MTPYDLDEAVRKADDLFDKDRALGAIFNLMRTLVRHESDKEAERRLERRAGVSG